MIALVDGAMNFIRYLGYEEFYKVLDEIEEFYKHPADLDGVQGEYGEDYFKRWMQDYTSWHVDHARNLKERTRCSSAIDVGCGVGNIVRGLLEVGVDAWGVDFSRYVVEHSDPSIRDNMLWGDLTKRETLPSRKFDLAIAYDVFEHVPMPETAVRNFCWLSRSWVHVKVPDIRGVNDVESKQFDPTHITGRSIKWWLEVFRSEGFELIMDERYTKLKWDSAYGYAPVGAPDLHALLRRRFI